LAQENAMRQPRHVGFDKVVCLGACLIAFIGSALAPATAAAQGNPVVVENQQTGTTAWDILNGSAPIATDSGGQIKGYASATSVNKGQNITFRVSVKPAQTFTIDVYRIGWYNGTGGRLMQHVGPLNGTTQATCPINSSTGLIECNWADSYTLATQTTWTSGIYLAVLKNAANYQNFIVFVVRDDSRVAPLMYQQPVTTYQAYNDYPNDNQTGKSLYDFNSYGSTTIGGTHGAVKVSFDRPYMDNGSGGDFFSWEINFIRWMEKSGYDVTYTTSVDTHTNGSALLNYRGFISSGHDEYWSKTMYDAAIAARDAGINLAFFGANSVYTQIRFEASSTGVPNRVMVCYRDASIDPNTDPTLETVNWRDAPLNRPEQTLVGVQFISQVPWNSQTGFATYVVNNSSNWVYAGTGFTDGATVPGIVGYEADQFFTGTPGPNAVAGTFTLLSHSTWSGGYGNSSVYQAPSGAWVFGAGTIQWSWGLDNYGNAAGLANAKIQKTTSNIFDRFINAQPPPNVTSVTPASGPTTGGTTITISGANFQSGATVTLGATAATGVTFVNANTIRATTPAGAVGAVGVTVVNPDGRSGTMDNAFTYVSTAPTVNTVAPSAGPIAGGTAITLTGTNYAAGATVTLGGTAATGVAVGSSTSLTATTPAHAAGSVTVMVTNPDGQSGSIGSGFTFLGPAPTLTNVAPTTGPTTGGTVLTLTGTNFVAGATVSVGGTAATAVTVVNATTINATTPAHTAGLVSVTVTNADTQSATRANSYTYSSTFPPPTVTGIAPTFGSTNGGTSVTISGTGFLTGAAVSVGGTAATGIVVVNNNTITATTPAHTAGAVGVTVTNTDGQSATLASAFNYLAPTGVAVDAVGPSAAGTNIGSGSSLTWNHTITTTGSNLLLTVGVVVGKDGDNTTSLAVTYNGVAMTSAGLVHANNSNTGYAQLFYLKAPATGTHAVQVTLTGGPASIEAGSVSFTGVDQTTPVRNITSAASSGTSPAVTVASAAGNMVVDVMATGCPGTMTSSQTLRWLNQFDCSTSGGNGAQSTAAGAASVTMGYTVPSDWWGIIAMDVVGAAAQPTFDFTLSNTGDKTVVRGSAVPNTITATLTTGTSQAVTLSASGMPSGVTASFSPGSCSPTCSSTLTLTASSSATLGTATITVTATAGSVTHTTSFNLTVNAPAPTMTSVAPTSGPTAGGTAITINGTNFLSGATVSVGGTAATGVTFVDSATITATTPAHASGLVGVSVANPDSQIATLANSFTYVPPPTVTGVSPTSGPITGGTAVTITGTGFATGATVTIGGGAASGVTVINSTTITASTPAHTVGNVSVSVVNPDSQAGTAANAFTYVSSAPSISSVAPASGPAAGGTSITISGTNLGAVVSVTIGGTAATGVTIVNSTTITATTPAHAAGAVDVTATDADSLSGTKTNAFTYLGPAPSVASIAPSSGPGAGGTAVTITGSNFAAGATVTIGGTAATGVSVVNATTITATTPAHAAGAADVTVTNADTQSGTKAGAFTYLGPAPTVTSVAPSSGPAAGGTSITITGTNFAAGATVSIGGAAATGVSVVNSTTITATTPANAAGAVSVTVTNADTQSGTKASAFTYLGPAPTVSGVSPTSGTTAGGTAVTISGTNFVSGATVSIGGTAATGVSVVNSSTITATTAAHAAGLVGVTVTNADTQSGTLASAFTYQAPAPTVTSVAPVSGSINGGTSITITGTGFVSGATVTVGGTAATGVSVVNATTITATTAAHAAGAVDVTVTNADTQSGTKTGAFTYLAPAPTVGSVAPLSGSIGGGTAITITGNNFVNGASVTIGGVPVTGVTVVNSTSITGLTGAHAAGVVNVTVTNPDTQSGTLTNGFTYVGPPPVVGSVAPTSGSASGGTAITVSGSNFLTGATVTVGGIAATGVTVVNATTIAATTAAHAAGAVDVTVINPDGQSNTLVGAYTYVATAGVVAVDSVGPGATGASVSGSTLSWNHTVTTTGSGMLLTAGVMIGKSPDTAIKVAVTYNGVPMTSAGLVHSNNRTDGYVQLFYLVAPATGTHAVQVTLTGGTAAIEAGSVSFTGVNQTTPFRNLTTAFGTGTTPTVTVASAPGNMVIDAMVTGCNGTITSSQTLRWLKTVNCATAGGNGAQSTAIGAASVRMGYTVPSDWWGIVAMDLIAQ
jgi:hypothetical protein